MKGRRFLVSGRVQGVGYRAFARRAAARLGLTGSATNLTSGEVDVVAFGPVEALDAFAAELQVGPVHGRVDAISASEVSDEADRPNAFDIS